MCEKAHKSIDIREKLLVIEMKDINDIPTVFYRGEEINLISKLSLNWDTITESVLTGNAIIKIEHFDESTRPASIRKLGHEKVSQSFSQ